MLLVISLYLCRSFESKKRLRYISMLFYNVERCFDNWWCQTTRSFSWRRRTNIRWNGAEKKTTVEKQKWYVMSWSLCMGLEMTTCRESLGKNLCRAMKGNQPITWPRGVSRADWDYSNPGIVVSAATWGHEFVSMYLLFVSSLVCGKTRLVDSQCQEFCHLYIILTVSEANSGLEQSGGLSDFAALWSLYVPQVKH